MEGSVSFQHNHGRHPSAAPEGIHNQSISSIGQDSDHGSREQRIWRFREELDRQAILESTEQTGLNGSQF
jgi:hypothetical protein